MGISVKSLMLIDCNEQDDVEEEAKDEEIMLKPKRSLDEKEPEFSIHAMEGGSSPQTIRLLGLVNKKPVSILLDTRSTHNFIDPRVVQRTGFVVTPEEIFSVTIAGGDILQSEGICKEVHIKCQGWDIVTDFHILAIGGCQMVLGVD